MSVELGIGAQYVYVTEDGLNGKTRDALVETADLMQSQGADWTAKEEVRITAASDRSIIDRNQHKGIYVFGASEKIRPSVNEPFDAIMYAEAEGRDRDGYFSKVNVALWVNAEAQKRLAARGVSLSETLLEMCLEPQGKRDMIWGVPIKRDALVQPRTEGNFIPYVYGHKKDTEAVGKLDVPAGLHIVLQQAVTTYHLPALQKNGLVFL